MPNKMEFAHAEKLKAEIKEAASDAGIDLTRPENDYTLWVRNGLQLLFHTASNAPNVLYFQIGHYQLSHAIIFRSSKPKVIEITTSAR